MLLHDMDFGRIQISTVPVPDGLDKNLNGTYTPSGRVLVAVREEEKGKDWYRVFTMSEEGTQVCELYSGEIPQQAGANGIRWMCFSDNRRILLGDYVLECQPDLDHCAASSLIDVVFPKEISEIPGLFVRWSEPLIAPDNEHICFSSLTGNGAFNFLGKLVRKETQYEMEDLCIISTVEALRPDPLHEGYYVENVHRGGEVKQFIRGGRGLTLAGSGRCITESTLQMLDSEETHQITETLGYEETAILSPNEKYAICMSPRFSPATDCGIFGVVPLYKDIITRRKYLNVLYNYAISGVRKYRSGSIGPALIRMDRSLREGRNYQGVDLSDPEKKWVYVSPMSWNPESTKAMWNESTRSADGPVKCRLRICHLLDAAPSEGLQITETPDQEKIPYALPVSAALEKRPVPCPVRMLGESGTVENRILSEKETETYYDHYSEDGKTYYDGWIRVKAPQNMFLPEETVIWSKLKITGEHQGEMDLRLTFQPGKARGEVYLARGKDEHNLPQSYGYAVYDGLRRTVEEMSD